MYGLLSGDGKIGDWVVQEAKMIMYKMLGEDVCQRLMTRASGGRSARD